MEIINYILFVVIGGWLLVTYLNATMDAALVRREKSIKKFKEIIDNEEHSRELRVLTGFLFHSSLDRWFLPKVIMGSLFGVSEKGRKVLGRMSKSERKTYYDFIKNEALPVNARVAPHWYFVFFVILFVVWMVVSAFRRTLHVGIATIKTKIEASVIGQTTPRRC